MSNFCNFLLPLLNGCGLSSLINSICGNNNGCGFGGFFGGNCY